MLTVPMILGLAAGGTGTAASWLIPPACVLVFLAHYAVVPYAQRLREGKASPPGYAARRGTWGALYLWGSASCFAGALLLAPEGARNGVLVIAGISALLAAVYAAAAVLGSGRVLTAEILGMAGMALAGPIIGAAGGREVAPSLFDSAAFALGYSLSSLAFVRAYEAREVDRAGAIRRCLLAHLGIACALASAAFAGVMPRFWWIAFLPVAARTAWGLARPPGDLRALGLRELKVAVSFTLLAGAALIAAS